eukprot:Gb_03770 [translate_table: standard]
METMSLWEINETANHLPLHGKIMKSSKAYPVYACFHLLLLLSFLYYRLLHPLDELYGVWMIALGCEIWFGFEWILDHNMRWRLVQHKTYPERLALRYSGESASKLPAVDIFVTTTDPLKESPIMTLNTVISALAMDYPPDKMACYVSDDGASPITFYSLVEASHFAKKWVPFCRKYCIETRAPFVYFSNQVDHEHSDQTFLQEWQQMKGEYEDLQNRITRVLETREAPLMDSVMNGINGFSYASSDIRNHSSIVQIICENKGRKDDGIPHLVYVAREKRPAINHHYKAGAMNVLARVSGVMTNAPFILNLDCDMHVNNSKVIQHAMCFFLDCKSERECGFVQFPQLFHGGLRDDPFGNQMKILIKKVGQGMNGTQGPIYGGTCCFHRRKGLYGVAPVIDNYSKDRRDMERKEFHDFSSSISYEALKVKFGESAVLAASAQTIIRDTVHITCASPSLVIKEAFKVASCTYENNTVWGKEVGWIYGSTTEDVLTGLKLHIMGWHSIYCTPENPAFLGSAPGNGPDTLVQQKRWATGLLEIFVSKLSPLLGIKRSIMVRQRMIYAYFSLWAVWSVPTLCYAVLPAYSLLSGKSFLPKISEPAFGTAAALFVSVYGFKLLEYVHNDCSIREWWNNQRMWLIVSVSSWLYALFDVLLKLIGLCETVFVVTPKGSDKDEDEDGEEGEFTFDSSSLYIPPTTLLLVNVAAIIRVSMGGYEMWKRLLAEYICSVFVVLNLWPFLKGLVRKGKRGIPWTVVIKSSLLALLVCSSCI